MKKIALLLLSFLFTLATYAQQPQYEDVVYLKNGSIIRGMIVEQVPNQSIKIQTLDRNVFVFEMDQVERITKEEVPQDIIVPQAEKPADPFSLKESGFEANVDMMLGINMDWGEPVIGLYASAGYRFFTQFYLGGGLGYEVLDMRTMLPVFLSVSNDFVRARVTPSFRIDFGHAFGWIEDDGGSDWGGIFIDPSIGVRFNFSERFSMKLSSGIKFQRAYEYDYYYYPMEEGELSDRRLETYRIFTFKVGFSF